MRNLFHTGQFHQVIIIGLLIAFSTFSFFAGFFANQVIESNTSSFPLLTEAFKILDDHFYKPLPEQRKIEYGMIKGMLQTVEDPFTTFLEPPQHELQTNQLEGKFGGIGIRLERDLLDHLLIFPLPKSPATQSGLRDGDWLVSIDQLVVEATTPIAEIQAAIRGPIGEIVEVEIWRAGETEPLHFSVKRAEILAPSVTHNISPIDPRVGIIQISVIAATTPDEITSAVDQLLAKGAKYFILDLRNNGGGLIEAGIEICRLFSYKGDIVYEKFRDRQLMTHTADENGPLSNLPLAILVNQNTASSSEIIAGVLQAQKRAIIVGSQTYGKDTIQLVYELRDLSSVHISAGKWWLKGEAPSQNWIGVQPDINLENDVVNGPQAQERAVEALLP